MKCYRLYSSIASIMNSVFIKAIIIACVLLFISSASFSQNWEVDFVKKVNPQNPHSNFWKGTTQSSKIIAIATPATLLAVGIIKKDYKLKEQAIKNFAGLAATIVVTEAAKRIIDRQRIYQKYPSIYPDEFKDGESLPSGHAAVAFSTAASLSFQFKKWYVVVPAFAWASAVSYSRFYLGQHYPSDIAASAVVGIGSAWLSHKATAWLTTKKTRLVATP